ncbi:MAG: hypothetical protein D6725_14035 [Planctomycetota bacterium]|nr:MAG: hypothetical protein D6725_14035 [Planctomycetota bacterium]
MPSLSTTPCAANDATTPTPSANRANDRVAHAFRDRLARATLALTAIGLVMQWFVRDRWSPLAVVYYALPPAGVFAVNLAAVLTARGTLRRVALMGLPAAAAWWCHMSTPWSFVFEPPRRDLIPSESPAERHGAHKLLLWNVARGVHGWAALADRIRSENADLVVLVEAEPTGGARLAFWRAALPEYHVLPADGGLIVAAKGRLRRRMRRHLDAGCIVGLFDVRLNDATELQLVAVDIKSRPTFDRGPALRALGRLVERLTRTGPPVLLAGDFNTPLGSVHFIPIRQFLDNAAERAGRGWLDTWPVPFPLMALDQVWLEPPLTAVRRTAGWSRLSDHRPVRVFFRSTSSP